MLLNFYDIMKWYEHVCIDNYLYYYEIVTREKKNITIIVNDNNDLRLILLSTIDKFVSFCFLFFFRLRYVILL